MTEPPDTNASPSFPADRARGAIGRFRDGQRTLSRILLLLLSACAIGVLLLFVLTSVPAWWRLVVLGFVGILVFSLASATIGVRFRIALRKRIARKLIRSHGSLCVTCRAPLPVERPLPPSVTRACCRETGELFSHAELQEWWERRIETPNPWWSSWDGWDSWRQVRQWPQWANPYGSATPLTSAASRRRLIVICVGTAGVMLAAPLAFGLLRAFTSGQPITLDRFLIDALSQLPQFAGLAAVMIGFHLTVMGLGWRVERGPFCAKCGYRWREGAAPHCPECGAAWNAKNGRRLHRTRLNPAILMTGVLLAAVGFISAFSTAMLAHRATLVPTSMLLASANLRASYCPHVSVLVDRSLTGAERSYFATLIMEEFHSMLIAYNAPIAAAGGRPIDSRDARYEGPDHNYRAMAWLADEITGAHGAVDPALASYGRSLIAPLAAYLVTPGANGSGSTSASIGGPGSAGAPPAKVLRLEGRTTHSPLRSATKFRDLRFAVEEPSIEVISSAETEPTESRRWGDPIDPAINPRPIARSGELYDFRVDRDSDWLRIEVPVERPIAPGRYVVCVRHWVIFDPAGSSLRPPPIVGLNGQVTIPPGGWAERYEHRFVIEFGDESHGP